MECNSHFHFHFDVQFKFRICVQPLDAIHDTTASSHSPNVDEGGFNEPSPEIKAKLKPAYTYEAASIAAAAAITNTTTTAATISACEQQIESKDTTDDFSQHSLHYVDFGYRLNPDGSESKQCFSDEHYDSVTQNQVNGNNRGGVVVVGSGNNVERQRFDKRTVHYPVADSVVYAAIKSEPSSLSPPFESKFNCGTYGTAFFLLFHQCADIKQIHTYGQMSKDYLDWCSNIYEHYKMKAVV